MKSENTKPYLEELTEIENKWQNLVGGLLLSFGKIEWFTYFLLHRLPTENIFESVKSLGFSKRTNLIKQLLESGNLTVDLQTEIKTLLSQACGLADVRNTIAHNPLYLGLYNGEGGIDFEYQISKCNKINPIEKPMKLTDLEKHYKRTLELANQCYELQGKVDHELFE